MDVNTLQPLARWRQQWRLLPYTLPAIANKNLPELKQGDFQHIGDTPLFDIVPRLMAEIELDSNFALAQLVEIAKDGDWLAKAKAWAALAEIDINLVLALGVLKETKGDNEGQSHFLAYIAGGIRHRAQYTAQQQEAELLMQKIMQNKGVPLPHTIIATPKSKPDPKFDLDIWFGNKIQDDAKASERKKLPNFKRNKKSKRRPAFMRKKKQVIDFNQLKQNKLKF